MQPLGIIIFLLAVVHPFLCNGEENAEVDPIFEYLQMRPEDVIEHELVHINTSQHMQKRAFGDFPDPRGTGMRFRAFGEDINLWLYPRDSLLISAETPVYFAYEDSSMSGGVRYELQRDAMRRIGRILEDPEAYATLIIGKDPLHDQPTVTGYMRFRRDNTALVIRPLSQEVVERHLRRRRSIASNELDSSLDSARHIVLKVKDFFPKFDMDQDFKKVNVRGNTSRPSRSVDLNSIDYSHSIYPKIFVQLDSTYWNNRFMSSHDEHERTAFLLTYVLAYWNGVDLTYRHLENPSIRFHISGIAIAKDPGATPFLSTSQQPQGGPVDSGTALTKQETFFFAIRDQIPLETYNIAVTMTQLKFKGTIAGMALTNTICNYPSTGKEAVVLVHDGGAFDSIEIAAHEVGHSFGLRHDDTRNGECITDSDDYIMGAVTASSDRKIMFSACSLAKFNELLQQGKLRCLYNPPQVKLRNLPKILPGKVLDLTAQCRMLGYEGRCEITDTDPCKQLICRMNSGSFLQMCRPFTHGAAPGTRCNGENESTPRYCIERRCIAVN